MESLLDVLDLLFHKESFLQPIVPPVTKTPGRSGGSFSSRVIKPLENPLFLSAGRGIHRVWLACPRQINDPSDSTITDLCVL